jgi:hypothetical protein
MAGSVQVTLPFLRCGAPGRAHPFGGESPLQTRQGELLAERQGCPPSRKDRARTARIT